jgi:hypothetical protein
MKKGEKKLEAFVAMCFDTKLDHIYLKVIKPSLEAFDVICTRGDEINKTGLIVDQIDEAINKADILICDLTYLNPNVFFELGIAHILKKPTILLTQQNTDFPFDVRHMRIITYVDSNIGLLDLREKLLGFISELIHKEKDERYISSQVFEITSNEVERQRYALNANAIELRRYAIRFLGDIGDKDSYEKIVRLLGSEKDSDILKDIFTAIFKIDKEKALDELLNSGLKHQSSLYVRERVVELLSNYSPSTDLVKQLIEQSKDTSWGVRRAVCNTLGKWCSKTTIETLQYLLSDPEVEVQLAANEALHCVISKSK